VAFVFFFAAIAAGIACVAIRKYKVVPEAEPIESYYNAYLASSDPASNLRENVLARLVGTKREAIVENNKRDRRKVWSWWTMVVAFGLAVLFSLISIGRGGS
jgi:hypothetical protein